MSFYTFYTAPDGRRLLKRAKGMLIVKRSFDTLLSAVFLLILGPFWFYGQTRRSPGESISIYLPSEALSFKTASGVKEFYDYQKRGFVDLVPVFWQIFRGRLSFVGPAPVETSQESPLYVSLGLAPGLFSTYSLKKQANLTLLDRDYELLGYLSEAGLKADFGILLRSFIGRLFIASDMDREAAAIQILGLRIDNLGIDDALEWIARNATDRTAVSTLAFVNPDCFNLSVMNKRYAEILKDSDRVFADGIGVHIACSMLNVSMKENLNGTDLFPRICELAQAERLSIYLLGGKPGVTDKMCARLRLDYPNLLIAGHRDGYFKSGETDTVIDQINEAGPDILLVAMGAPNQETWIADNKSRLHIGLAMGVGGLFDFVSGSMPRAPLWMREIGLEWLYRLYQEPGRMWRRYILGNPLFLYRIWRSKRLMENQRDSSKPECLKDYGSH